MNKFLLGGLTLTAIAAIVGYRKDDTVVVKTTEYVEYSCQCKEDEMGTVATLANFTKLYDHNHTNFARVVVGETVVRTMTIKDSTLNIVVPPKGPVTYHWTIPKSIKVNLVLPNPNDDDFISDMLHDIYAVMEVSA